ncbi:MAG: oxidoreductase, partial [Natronospirillum sp.]
PVDLLLEAHGVVVFERNGEPMPVRAYGPFWLLFPFSERPELVNRDIRNVSVWQLKKIEFLP